MTTLKFLLDVNAPNAASTFDKIGARLGDLDRKLAKTRQIGVGDADAAAKIARLGLQSDRLKDKLGSMDITIRGAQRAEAQLLGLEATAGRLDKKLADAGGSRIGKIGQASFLQPSGLGTALALIPAAIPAAATLTAGVGLLGISFAGAAAGAGLLGLLAKQALSGASTAAQAVEKAQNTYNASIATGTKRATAYRTEQKAISLAYAQMTPQQIALSKAIGSMQNAWQGVQQSTTPLISGALLPWIGSAESLLKDIRPAVAPIAAIFRSWGQTIQEYFASGAGSDELHRMADAFGNFSATQIYLVGQFIFDIGRGVAALGHDLAGNGANFSAAGIWFYNMGQGFAGWAKSAQARRDVQGFMHYIRTEGPVLGGILKDLGRLIPGIFAGATATGTLELRTIGWLLGLVAKLPSGWAKPLTEAAGAILLLSKTGILKVGFTVVGAASGWVRKLLGGASVDIGAAGMQTAGDTMLAAARAMQRAADTMAGTTAAADIIPAAGGKIGKIGKAGGALALGSIGGPVVLGTLATATIVDPWLKSTSSGKGGRNWLDNPFGQGVATDPKTGKTSGKPTWLSSWDSAFKGSLAGAIVSGKLGHQIAAAWDLTWNNTITRTAKGFHDIAGRFDTGRHEISRIQDLSDHYVTQAWNTTWNNTIARGQRGLHDIAHVLDILRHTIAGDFDGMRRDSAVIWNSIWNNTVARVRRGIGDTVNWIGKLPGEAVRALGSLGTGLYKVGSAALTQLWHGLQAGARPVTSWLSGFAHGVVGIFKKIWGWFSPSSVMYEGGKSLMTGLAKGIEAHAHKAQAAAAGAAGAVGGKAVGSLQKYAQVLLASKGWGSQFGSLDYIINAESGWRWNAQNPASGAYGIPQALPGSKMAAAGSDWRTNPLTQLRWMILDYLGPMWGSPARAAANERMFHWYGHGGRFSAHQLIGVGERGPELAMFDRPGRIFSPEQSAAAMSRDGGHRGPLMNVEGDMILQQPVDATLLQQQLSVLVAREGLG